MKRLEVLSAPAKKVKPKTTLKSAPRKGTDEWWKAQSKAFQKRYLKEHPSSKFNPANKSKRKKDKGKEPVNKLVPSKSKDVLRQKKQKEKEALRQKRLKEKKVETEKSLKQKKKKVDDVLKRKKKQAYEALQRKKKKIDDALKKKRKKAHEALDKKHKQKDDKRAKEKQARELHKKQRKRQVETEQELLDTEEGEDPRTRGEKVADWFEGVVREKGRDVAEDIADRISRTFGLPDLKGAIPDVKSKPGFVKNYEANESMLEEAKKELNKLKEEREDAFDTQDKSLSGATRKANERHIQALNEKIRIQITKIKKLENAMKATKDQVDRWKQRQKHYKKGPKRTVRTKDGIKRPYKRKVKKPSKKVTV